MSTNDNAAVFVAMSPQFEGHYDKPLADLPKNLGELVERNPNLRAIWDVLSEERRRSALSQCDRDNDPANIPARQAGFYGFDEAAALAGLTALEAAGLLLTREGELLERLGIPCDETDAPPLAKKLLTLEEMRTSGVDGTIHPLAEWLQRARKNGIAYLPGLDWAVEHCSSMGKNGRAAAEAKTTDEEPVPGASQQLERKRATHPP